MGRYRVMVAEIQSGTTVGGARTYAQHNYVPASLEDQSRVWHLIDKRFKKGAYDETRTAIGWIYLQVD